jgi:hypothetical protein
MAAMTVRSVCVAWGKRVSCRHYSGIPKLLRGNCRDSSCRRGTKLSSPHSSAMFVGFYGRGKPQRILRLLLGGTSERPNAGLLASMSHRLSCSSLLSTKCSSDSNQSRGRTESRRAPHLVGEDNRSWESRAINIGRLDGQESGSGHRQKSASHTASVSNEAVCGAVRGALVLLPPLSAGRSGNGSITAARTTPITRWSADPERRAKALGPHSERVPVARHPRDHLPLA